MPWSFNFSLPTQDENHDDELLDAFSLQFVLRRYQSIKFKLRRARWVVAIRRRWWMALLPWRMCRVAVWRRRIAAVAICRRWWVTCTESLLSRARTERFQQLFKKIWMAEAGRSRTQ